MPQRTVLRVEHPAPDDASRVELGAPEPLPPVEGVVGERREQVVRGRHGVDVAGEVQVDVRGRLERCATAPVAPPLRPKIGPSDGWRRASTGRLPMRRMPIARAIATVVFPSPAGVGLMAVTRISLPGSGGRSPGPAGGSATLAFMRP